MNRRRWKIKEKNKRILKYIAKRGEKRVRKEIKVVRKKEKSKEDLTYKERTNCTQ